MTQSPRITVYLDLEHEADETNGDPSPELVGRIDAAWKRLTPAEVTWLRARPVGHGVGPFENAARRRKVLKILEFVPTGASRVENQICAEWLRGMSPPERGLFAKLAKCNAPSEETWRQLIEAVKARKTVDEVDALARELIR